MDTNYDALLKNFEEDLQNLVKKTFSVIKSIDTSDEATKLDAKWDNKINRAMHFFSMTDEATWIYMAYIYIMTKAELTCDSDSNDGFRAAYDKIYRYWTIQGCLIPDSCGTEDLINLFEEARKIYISALSTNCDTFSDSAKETLMEMVWCNVALTYENETAKDPTFSKRIIHISTTDFDKLLAYMFQETKEERETLKKYQDLFKDYAKD